MCSYPTIQRPFTVCKAAPHNLYLRCMPLIFIIVLVFITINLFTSFASAILAVCTLQHVFAPMMHQMSEII